MNPFNPGGLVESLQLPDSMSSMLLRLLMASGLAAMIAYRPWRRFMDKTLPIATDTAQAQVIISVAGCVMVIIIGDSMARAFGLVGLGAFIRFRSGIKDPRDAAVMFVMIGIGMAVGLALYPIAILTTAFVGVILSILDASGKAPLRRVKIGIDVSHPKLAVAPIRPIFPAAKVIEAPNGEDGAGRLVLEIDAAENVDAASILELLELRGVPGIRGVALVED